MNGVSEIVQTYVRRAKAASYELLGLNQENVNELAYRCAKAVHKNAEFIARLAVEETGMGNVHDKILKKKSKSETAWIEIKDKKTVGVVWENTEKRLAYFADPIGVIAGVAPCTNPAATAMFYSMICLKTRNALLICPHPRAVKTTLETVRLMKEEMACAGYPEHAIQVVFDADLHSNERFQLTTLAMGQADMVIATGGPKLVELAYQSGKPAYGVGAGNTPVIVHPSANVATAVKKILEGRCFDNGIICASEQHIIFQKEQEAALRNELQQQGAYILDNPDEQKRFEAILFNSATHHLNAEFVGQSAEVLADAVGIRRSTPIRCFVFPIEPADLRTSPLAGEKMAPILSFIKVGSFDESIAIANRLLAIEGRGHSAAIHIEDAEHSRDLLKFAERMPATHLIVNMPAATSSGGSRYNWLTPSTTLGCGSYGGTMPMESINLSVKQLLNYKAIAMPLAVSRIPEEVFV